MEENNNKPVENGVVDSQVSQDEKTNQVPMHRFNEVIAERNELRESIKSIEADKEQARAKPLKNKVSLKLCSLRNEKKGKL